MGTLLTSEALPLRHVEPLVRGTHPATYEVPVALELVVKVMPGWSAHPAT